jgi:cellulose synthase (UDP-forming)
MVYHGISLLGGAARLVPWLLILSALVAMISVPTSLGVQALLGVTGVGAVFLMRSVAHSRIGRLTLLGIASIIVLRYWFWRLFDTLPAPDDQVSFVAAVALFAVETYLIGVFFLSCFVVADPVDHRRPAPVKVRDLPTVDVLIPSLNEPANLLAVTLAAAKNISYPEPLLNVVLCDDGGTDARCMHEDPAIAFAARARREELSALCEELGVIYCTRAENRGAKAGNLTEALAGLDGEYVAIFDADHMPSRDFLARTIGYFVEDSKLALVQTPHFFLNADPIARNLKLSEATPPENEMFYSLMHRGLDRWGGAFFCGSAAVLRREAIDSVGGISGKTITEDAETAMMIHGKGWRSMYVNHAMVAGLQPESFASFLQQRGRWATGMTQLLMTRNPFLVRGLTAWQRLCYLNSMSYWVFPVVRLMLLMAPLLYLFFGLEIVVTTAPEALAYAGSYLAVGYMVQNTLFSSVRWPFLSEIYEIAQAPYLFRAVVGAVLRPRSARFKVTSKDETITSTRLSDVYRPLFALFLLMVAGLGVLAWRYINFPGDRDVLNIVGAWAIFNTILVGASLRAIVEQRQRRKAPRVAGVNRPAVAELSNADGDAVATPCVISDISYGGLRIAIPPRALGRDMRRPSIGDQFQLAPAQGPNLETPSAVECRVAFCGTADGRLVLGAAFAPGQTREAYLTVAAMLNGDSRRWQAIRATQTATRRGLVVGFVHATRLAGAGVYHALATILTDGGASSAAQGASELDAGWSTESPVEAQAFIAARNLRAFPPRRSPRPVPEREPEREPRHAAFSETDAMEDANYAPVGAAFA